MSPWPAGKNGRHPNLSPTFVQAFGETIGLRFVSDGVGDLAATFGPEDVLAYVYAVLHSPSYRTRYASFLSVDFARIPLPNGVSLFRSLAVIGHRLLSLHLMESNLLDAEDELIRYPVGGTNDVAAGFPRYVPPVTAGGRVYLNQTQYFEGVSPATWAFEVGGYQVAEKWLKDRRGRTLSYDELQYYKRVLVALAESLEAMAAIDAIVGQWPLSSVA